MRRTMALKTNLTTNGINGWRSQVEWRHINSVEGVSWFEPCWLFVKALAVGRGLLPLDQSVIKQTNSGVKSNQD